MLSLICTMKFYLHFCHLIATLALSSCAFTSYKSEIAMSNIKGELLFKDDNGTMYVQMNFSLLNTSSFYKFELTYHPPMTNIPNRCSDKNLRRGYTNTTLYKFPQNISGSILKNATLKLFFMESSRPFQKYFGHGIRITDLETNSTACGYIGNAMATKRIGASVLLENNTNHLVTVVMIQPIGGNLVKTEKPPLLVSFKVPIIPNENNKTSVELIFRCAKVTKNTPCEKSHYKSCRYIIWTPYAQNTAIVEQDIDELLGTYFMAAIRYTLGPERPEKESCSALKSLDNEDEKNMIGSRTAELRIDSAGVRMSLNFKQDSPLDKTTISGQISGLKSGVKSIYLHEFPVRTNIKAGTECSVDIIGGKVVDPYGISGSGDTTDMFPMGDFSGKHGKFIDGQDNFAFDTSDWSFPLFGDPSVIGRSLAVYNKDGKIIACGSILPRKMLSSEAIFVKDILGKVTFLQFHNNPYNELRIFSQLSFAKMQNEDTTLELSIINKNTNDATLMLGLHCFDSQNNKQVEVDSIYNVTYSKSAKSHLALFDKFASSIPKESSIFIKKTASVNTHIPSCATLRPYFAANSATSSNVGVVRLSQPSEFHPTLVKMEIKSLPDKFASLQIDEQPDCPSNQVPRLFNPFNVNMSNEVAVGELSRRLGITLSSNKNYLKSVANLPIQTAVGVAGRALTYMSSESILKCIPLSYNEEDLSQINKYSSTGVGAFMVRAKITFEGAKFTGTVEMSQMYFGYLGSFSDTLVVFRVSNKDKSQTKNHKWSVNFLSPSDADSCNDTREIYNPFSMDYLSNSSFKCSSQNPLHCKLGDTSGKTSTLDIDGKTRTFLVTYLPLWGAYSVMGRSLLVKDNKESIIGCGEIAPDSSGQSTLMIGFKSMNYTKTQVISTLVSVTKEPRWIFGVEGFRPKGAKDGCVYIKVIIMGPQDKVSIIRERLQMHLQQYEQSALGKFSMSKKCEIKLKEKIAQKNMLPIILGSVAAVVALAVVIVAIVLMCKRRNLTPDYSMDYTP